VKELEATGSVSSGTLVGNKLTSLGTLETDSLSSSGRSGRLELMEHNSTTQSSENRTSYFDHLGRVAQRMTGRIALKRKMRTEDTFSWEEVERQHRQSYDSVIAENLAFQTRSNGVDDAPRGDDPPSRTSENSPR
jgi:hypothetical protein